MMKNTETIEASQPALLTATTFQRFADAELLDAWNRDRLAEAFTELVHRHGKMVLSVCRRKCCRAADADDAFQTTFLLLAKNSAKISHPECLAGWLHRVAHRASIATLSPRNREPERALEQAMIDDPLDRITQQHDAIALDEELAELPEHYRAALVMHVYEDCTLERMAEHFQTTLGSIRGRLQRGKKLLAGRLRRRGVVPLIAFAAAGSISVSGGEVTAASNSLLKSLADGQIPQPPISENLLHPLVQSGRKIMNPWNIVGGISAAGTIAALLIAPGFGSDGGGSASSAKQIVVSIPAERDNRVAQFAAPDPALNRSTPNANAAAPSQSNLASGQQNSVSDPNNAVTVVQRRYRPVTADSPTSIALTEMMDEPIELQVQGTIRDIIEQLESQLGQPVLISTRVIEYAEVDENTAWNYDGSSEPLRTALRKLLQPIGLKATIENDGMVITADHSELVHRGIGCDQWLNVNDAMMRQSNQKLIKTTSLTCVETPLSEAIQVISDTLELPIVIDLRSLEEIGLTADVVANIDVQDLPAYDILFWMLREHDLTLTVANNRYTVTSSEAAEEILLGRVYWLEGVGVGGDFDGLIQLIESTIKPDSWSSMGGNSTLTPAPGTRPGIVCSATLETHLQIEQLLTALRENSFGQEAISEDVQVVPAAPIMQGGGFGTGGGGFGGGGGGGGFF